MNDFLFVRNLSCRKHLCWISVSYFPLVTPWPFSFMLLGELYLGVSFRSISVLLAKIILRSELGDRWLVESMHCLRMIYVKFNWNINEMSFFICFCNRMSTSQTLNGCVALVGSPLVLWILKKPRGQDRSWVIKYTVSIQTPSSLLVFLILLRWPWLSIMQRRWIRWVLIQCSFLLLNVGDRRLEIA